MHVHLPSFMQLATARLPPKARAASTAAKRRVRPINSRSPGRAEATRSRALNHRRLCYLSLPPVPPSSHPHRGSANSSPTRGLATNPTPCISLYTVAHRQAAQEEEGYGGVASRAPHRVDDSGGGEGRRRESSSSRIEAWIRNSFYARQEGAGPATSSSPWLLSDENNRTRRRLTQRR